MSACEKDMRTVFAKGEYVHECKLGTVTMKVPRDITAADLARPLARLMEGSSDAIGKERAA